MEEPHLFINGEDKEKSHLVVLYCILVAGMFTSIKKVNKNTNAWK